MAKLKLVILVGLPASGKSTFARKLVDLGFVRTNKDDLRLEMFDGEYKRKDEKKVVKERNRLVREALSQGKSVVVDDTNLNPVHIKELTTIGKEYGAEIEVEDSFLAVPLEVCIKRDSEREKSVGEQVIREMFHKYIKKPHTALEYDPALPMVVVCDIDGTLAHMNDKRKPYDWAKVGVDEVDSGVAHLLDAIRYIDYAKIFLFSGRNEVCRPETEEWLERHDIDYDLLVMRPRYMPDSDKENNLDDREIKRNMLEKYVVGKYNVLFVVDDRPRVCKMWRDEFGLRVMQVGDPYYDF